METIRELCEKYDNIKGIGFARNFGQHAALMADLDIPTEIMWCAWMMTDRPPPMKWISC